MRRLFSFLTLFVLLAAAPAGAQTEQSVTEGDEYELVLEYGESAETKGGSAKENEDYEPSSLDTQLAGGTFRVQTREDSAVEGPEQFVVVVQKPLGEEEVVVTITDDEPTLDLVSKPVSESEGGAVLAVVASAVTENDVTVGYSVASGTASDADFDGRSGTVTIPKGQRGEVLGVPLTKDEEDEQDETFTVRLENPAGATIGKGEAGVTIVNDDLRSLSIADADAREGDGENAVTRLIVSLNAPTFRTVTVQYATLDGVARAPIDYLSRLGTLTFAPGQTQQFVDLAVVSDERKERTELFGVLLGKEQGATIQRGAAVVSVEDDDAEPNPDEMPPAMRVSKPKLKGRSVRVRVTCPKAETRCKGRLTLFTVADRKAKSRSLRRERRLGRKSYTLTSGQGKTVKMTLSTTVVAAARASGRLRVRAFALTSDPSDNVDTTERSATLKFKRTTSASR